ncbi:MAG: redoxin domain-containing protein [Gemmatimonadetes bacterium]|nr:redoxin domain-containing protein [Gemmatimonadota bacterium]
MIGTLVNVLDPIATFLLDATIKTTLFMGLVLLAVWLLDTRQAAKRSLLLNWCLVGVLVIPIASLCMPSLRFQFDSPPFPSEPAVPPAERVVAPDTPLAKSPPVLKQQKVSTKALSQNIEFSQDFVSPSPAQIVFAQNASTKSIDWTTYILNKITSAHTLYGIMAIYAIGLLVLLIRIIYCLIMVYKFRQSLMPCEDEQLQNNLQVLKNQLGIRRSVALAVSDKIGSPTQVGLLKPVVVLPTPMVESRGQLKSILIHELIHVKRWDCLYRLLAMVGMAFYWFNPLFHRVKCLLFEVQEQACDDWTVTTTGNSESYADTLLNVATQLRPRPAIALGMDMARTTQVMARVNRIITLGGHVSPRVGRVSALVMAVVFIGGATTIGSLTTSKVDHNDQKVVFEGGVAVTDTSDVSQRTLPMKMRDGRRLWWRGENGLYLQDRDAWQKFTLPEGGSFDQIHAFMQARNGSMWFTGIYKNGPIVMSFSGKTWQIWDSKTTGLGKITAGYDFAEDNDGGIWISHHGMGNIRAYGGADRFKGGNGVLHFDGKAWRNYTVKDGLIHNRVYNVEADPKGGVWIATLRGLSHYKNGKWISHIVDSMPIEGVRNGNIYDGHKVYKLFSDQKGTLWAAHGSTIGRTITRHISGISSFDGTAWTHYDAHVGLPVNAYRNIWQTKNGDLWFGTHQGDQQKVEAKGLVRYKNGMWLRFTRKHGIPGDFVGDLAEKGDGSFYLGVSGIVSYKPPIDHLSTISGKVIDQRDGQPVANMGIWVEYDDGEVHAGTMTDEDGLYRVEVTPGSYRMRIASKNATEPVTVEAKSESKIEDIDLLLLNSRRISGRVLDTSDNPIANAVVVISDDSSEDRRLSPQIVTTDANGKFEGWQVSGPKATFEVAAEGYAQIVREVENAIEEQVVISLKKGKTFRGRVVDELGTPIAWARVGLGPPPDPEKKVYTLPALPFQRNTYTDASGLFTLNDVAEGHIWVHHPEIGMVNQEVMPAEDVTDIRIERLRLYSVSGVVSLTGVPVERLRVSTTSFTGAKSRPQVGRPDANGAYRQEGLEPGKYHIAVLAPEKEERDGRTIAIHRNVQSQVLVIKDRDVTLNFEPLGDARITGVATYKGQPVSDVAISIHTIGDDPENFVSLNGKKTNKEGRFELRGLPSARITISFRKMERLVLGGKRWSKVDRIDLTNKKELSYIAELEMEERPTLSLGDMAPEFEAKQLDGSTFRLADYRGKKAVLIDFWATWCPPCVDEIPTIKKIAETYRDQGLEVVGVSLDREEKALRDFVKQEKLSYVQVFEKEKTRAITKSYGVWGMPSVFLIDKDGVINAIKLRGTRTEAAVKALLDTGLQTANGNSR